MSNRLTTAWTTTLAEAFGANGNKGHIGELFMVEVFQHWGWDVIHHESNQTLQKAGIDISFKNPKWKNMYTCDVKNNLTSNGTFYVYANWLFKSKANRIFHVNPNTGAIVWYDVGLMKKHYRNSTEERLTFNLKTIETVPWIFKGWYNKC